eukprot:73891-Prorocentrum_minimum.AAC.1
MFFGLPFPPMIGRPYLGGTRAPTLGTLPRGGRGTVKCSRSFVVAPSAGNQSPALLPTGPEARWPEAGGARRERAPQSRFFFGVMTWQEKSRFS